MQSLEVHTDTYQLLVRLHCEDGFVDAQARVLTFCSFVCAAECVQGVHAAGGAEQGAAGPRHPPHQGRVGSELREAVAADAVAKACFLRHNI